MKKDFIFVSTIVLLSLLLFSGSAFANTSNGYNPENDIVISITLFEDYIEPDESTGEYTFQKQENAHILFEDTTNYHVDHFYIWIEFNNKRILAIDPPRPMFN